MFMVPVQANASSNNATCRLLAQHKLADSAAYKPGVDVDGNPVVPADLNTEPEAEPEIETEAGTETDSDTDTETETETEAESPVGVLGDLSKVAKIPHTVDIAERVAGLAGTGVELNAPLGMIEIHEDGTVKYNGEDWTKSMLTLCGLSHREATVKEVEDSKVEMPEPHNTKNTRSHGNAGCHETCNDKNPKRRMIWLLKKQKRPACLQYQRLRRKRSLLLKSLHHPSQQNHLSAQQKQKQI